MGDLLTPEMKALNRVEFDRVTNLLNGIGGVVSQIKHEIDSLCFKFKSMSDILAVSGNEITENEKMLYDIQIQSFLHTIYMYLLTRDTEGNLYINPITSGTVTYITLTVNLPNFTTTKTIACFDNVTFDIINWNVYFGSITPIKLLREAEMEEQYNTTAEIPTPYFSKTEFFVGITHEREKFLWFWTQIIRMERMLYVGLQYISELKNLGLYN